MENFINFGGSFPDTMGSIHKSDIYFLFGSAHYKHTENVISDTCAFEAGSFQNKN